MSDESQVIRSIDWKRMFPFIGIFRGFRIAVHPSKLMLALIAMALVSGGGSLLDLVWPRTEQTPVIDEMNYFEASRGGLDQDKFFNSLRQQEIDALDSKQKLTLEAIGKPNGTVEDLREKIFQERDAAVAQAETEYAKSPQPGAEAMRELQIQSAYQDARNSLADLQGGRQGIYYTFRSYELAQINAIVRGVRGVNFVGTDGVTAGMIRFFSTGPAWAVEYHPIFFLVYGIYFLVIWSVFGGAITRIAAVHFARDEKISVRQALAFSTSKFLSFVSAPIIPLLIIVGMGLVLAVGGIVANVPVLGPMVIGILFVGALAAGFVMTLVMLGLAGGFTLMYPTIAVEGSDSFDAISRSFSYLYARPWRLAFYSAVSIAYGALTYLFVRYFIFILLSIVHVALGKFVFAHAASQAQLFQTMWPSPTSVGRLSYDVDWISLTPSERVGAGLIAFWVSLVVYMLGAFTISFYFSISTIIYYLMRNDVDSTELDDVHLDPTEEEFADTPSGPPLVAGVSETIVTVIPDVPPPTA